jgi:Na+/glutamate symporter
VLLQLAVLVVVVVVLVVVVVVVVVHVIVGEALGRDWKREGGRQPRYPM